jgi:hypothetical protein
LTAKLRQNERRRGKKRDKKRGGVGLQKEYTLLKPL